VDEGRQRQKAFRHASFEKNNESVFVSLILLRKIKETKTDS
jgi:hypothetical protein